MITRHNQVVQSPISNDYLIVIFDDKTEPQLVPKLLLKVSVREPHIILVSDPNDGGLKDARDKDDNIIIRDYKLRPLFPPQLQKCQHDTRSCLVVNIAFLIKVYVHHFWPGVIGI